MIELEGPAPNSVSALGLIPLCANSRSNVLSKANSILRHRILMMSSEGDGDWVRYLTWDSSQADELQLALTRARGCGDHEELIGYMSLDSETYLAVVKVTLHVMDTELEKTLWVKFCLGIEETTNLLQWQLYELSMASPESRDHNLKILKSIEEVRSSAASDGRDTHQSLGGQNRGEDQDNLGSDDDYWGKYVTDEDEDSNAADEIVSPGVDYYDRYDEEVDTAIRSDSPVLQSSAIEDPSSASILRSGFHALVPEIVRHAEQSFTSLRDLCRASNLSDAQIRAIFDKVML